MRNVQFICPHHITAISCLSLSCLHLQLPLANLGRYAMPSGTFVTVNFFLVTTMPLPVACVSVCVGAVLYVPRTSHPPLPSPLPLPFSRALEPGCCPSLYLSLCPVRGCCVGGGCSLFSQKEKETGRTLIERQRKEPSRQRDTKAQLIQLSAARVEGPQFSYSQRRKSLDTTELQLRLPTSYLTC